MQLAGGLLVAGTFWWQAFWEQALLFGQPPSDAAKVTSRGLFAAGAWALLASFAAAGVGMALAYWISERRAWARRRGPSFSALLAAGWVVAFFVVGRVLTAINDNSNSGSYPFVFGWSWFVGGALVVPIVVVVVFLVRFRPGDEPEIRDIALPGVVRADRPASPTS